MSLLVNLSHVSSQLLQVRRKSVQAYKLFRILYGNLLLIWMKRAKIRKIFKCSRMLDANFNTKKPTDVAFCNLEVLLLVGYETHQRVPSSKHTESVQCTPQRLVSTTVSPPALEHTHKLLNITTKSLPYLISQLCSRRL